jgi:hypothetical protein
MRNTPPVVIAVCLIIIAVLSTEAIAAPKVLAACGPSEGYAYYFPGEANKDTLGWMPDRISKGQIVLVADGSGFDLIFPGPDGQTTSAKTQGGHVTLYGSSGNFDEVIVGVSYSGRMAVETFYFRFSDANNGEVLFTKLMGGGMLPKGHMFNAKCQR